MSDQHDAADAQAIDRLERALDRIAVLVQEFDAEASHPGVVEGLSAAELRARLDQLIVKLRATLAVPSDAHDDDAHGDRQQ